MNIIGIMPTTKTIRLNVNPHTHTAKLPTDYVDYIRVAMVCRSQCGYETLINLVYNDDIALQGEDTRLRCTPEEASKFINKACDFHDNLHGRKLNPNWQPGQSQWNSYNTQANSNCNQWEGNGWGDDAHGGGCGCGCQQNSGEYKNFQQGVWQQGLPTEMPLPGTYVEQGCSPNPYGAWGDGGFALWGWGSFYGGVFNYSAVNFGIGPGVYRGGYRINKELNTIQFDSCFNCHKIILEYKTNGFDGSGDAVVPIDCINALNSYIHWQRNLHGQGSLQEKYLMRKDAEMHRQMYFALREDVISRLNSMTEEDYTDSIRRYRFQQVKA
jgi:hypothetical protein